MAPKFGTSGLRGLVAELDEALVADYTRAFLAACETRGRLCIGEDLRPSSSAIAATIRDAALAEGVEVISCGVVPTPALALEAMAQDAGAIMVTGSHIPADRNGLKFYTATGEITKADEARITGALGRPAGAGLKGAPISGDAGASFAQRYLSAYGPEALTGRRIGVYSHSAAGRDLLIGLLRKLGAEVIGLGRSEAFIPVDTEAIDPGTRTMLAQWAQRHGLDAIASTDGDSDRPMLTDETGRVIPGDVLGQITAQSLGAEVVVTPVSSNSGVAQMGGFREVIFTRIGSPFVIEGMRGAKGKVAGYEANGGFLLGFTAACPAGPLAPLPTRDSFLPIIAPLALKGPLSALVAHQPARFTASDRLQDIPTQTSAALVARLVGAHAEREAFLGNLGQEAALDLTDGLKMILEDGRIIHLRPSGNAPELRLYVEAESRAAAEALLADGLARLRALVGQ